MDAISGLRTTVPELARPISGSAGGANSSGFSETLDNAMSHVEALRGDAQQQVSALLSGNGAELHSTMIAVEKADVAFQLMMQVRNKIVAAYQEVERMQF